MQAKTGNEDQRKSNHIEINVSPELANNPEELLNPDNKVFMSDVLNPTQKSLKQSQARKLVQEIDDQLMLLLREYKNTQIQTNHLFQRMDETYKKVQRIKLQNQVNYPKGKMDFSFLTKI